MRLQYTGFYLVHGLDKDKCKDLSAEDIVTEHVASCATGHEDPHRELAARCDALERIVGKLLARVPESDWLDIAPCYNWRKP